MDLSYRLQQEQSLKLTMTPSMQQSIFLLQLSCVDLDRYLTEWVYENPLVELRYDAKPPNPPLMESFIAHQDTLEQYLLHQLRLLNLSPRQCSITSYLAGSLNEHGYLDETLSEISRALEITMEETEKALHILQSLEPAGVGARSVKECLLIQIHRDPYAEPWAYEVVNDHLENVASRKLKTIAIQLNITEEEVVFVIDYIQTLNPRPGNGFGHEMKYSIIPDAFVSLHGNELQIQMNDAYLPRVSFIEGYDGQIHKNNPDAWDFFKKQSESAQALIRCLDLRKRTLYQVINTIMREQLEFFSAGEDGFKPLTLKKVGERLGLHESTVSRAVRNKYIETDKGIYELKSFFSANLRTDLGEEVSTKGVKWKIKRWIEQEDKARPLSDQKIADLLLAQGIQISRRTVAKYREELKLLHSMKRKS